MSNSAYQGSGNGLFSTATEVASEPELPFGLRTPSRLNKRTRYSMDQRGSYNPSASDHAAGHQDQQQQQQQNDRSDQADSQGEPSSHERASGTTSGETSARSELEETRLLLKALDAIDTSMSEARDKLKTFYKTADETNTLLDMWIRVLSQSEHIQKLLQDPAWEGLNIEEARDREHQERRAAYQQAVEEANRRHSLVHSHVNNNGSSATSTPVDRHGGSGSTGAKKSTSSALAAAQAHVSAIAANRKKHLGNTSSTSAAESSLSASTATHSSSGGKYRYGGTAADEHSTLAPASSFSTARNTGTQQSAPTQTNGGHGIQGRGQTGGVGGRAPSSTNRPRLGRP
ncbi:hypothetical protein BGZ72_006797 [Mortierella alpina]|nr:hypothetical protein BGZ72_006797 [Mortierella alpina]